MANIDTQTSAGAGPVYPDHMLREGTQSSEVARMQTYLNAIGSSLTPPLSTLKVDGIFGPAMKKAVEEFQAYEALEPDGVVGKNTWDAIVSAYNAKYSGSEATWPGISLRQGTQGSDVKFMQQTLNTIDATYGSLGSVKEDGVYGAQTAEAVRLFQRQFGLTADGTLGHNTWERILEVQQGIDDGKHVDVTTPYPGTVLQPGSYGDSVRLIQHYLNRIRSAYNNDWPELKVDGKFGIGTSTAVMAFQADRDLKIDGKIGPSTWSSIVSSYNDIA